MAEEGDGLQRLAQPHLVSQDAVGAELPEVGHPLEPGQLVVLHHPARHQERLLVGEGHTLELTVGHRLLQGVVLVPAVLDFLPLSHRLVVSPNWPVVRRDPYKLCLFPQRKFIINIVVDQFLFSHSFTEIRVFFGFALTLHFIIVTFTKVLSVRINHLDPPPARPLLESEPLLLTALLLPIAVPVHLLEQLLCEAGGLGQGLLQFPHPLLLQDHCQYVLTKLSFYPEVLLG